MNNYEKDERAQELSDTMTAYALARRIVELEEALKKLKEEIENGHTGS